MRAPLLLLTCSIAACGGSTASRPEGGSPAGADREAGAARQVDPPAEPGAMAPRLVRSRRGGTWLTWLEPAPDGGHRVRVSRLGRGAWSRAVTVASGPRLAASWADAPSLTEGEDGTLVVSWSETAAAGAHAAPAGHAPPAGHHPTDGAKAPGPGEPGHVRPADGHATHVMLARSTDGGASWTRIGPAHDDTSATEHGFASLLADGGGRALAFWLDGRATAGGGNQMLRHAEVTGAGGAGGAGGGARDVGALDERVCECCPTAAAMTELGPVLVYRDRGEDEARDISIVRRVDGAWTAPAPVHRDGWKLEACPVNGPAIDARGRDVAVAWYTRAGGAPRVQVAFSSDGGASFAAPLVVDAERAGRAPIGGVSVSFDSGPSALVSWVAARGDSADVLVRRVRPDGRTGAERALARTGARRSAGQPRMTVAGGELVLAWNEPGAPGPLRALELPAREIPSAAALAGFEAPEEPALGLARPGQQAPAYRAQSPDGAAVSLEEKRGTVILVNLWATWCAPCKEEMPELAALHRRYAPRGLEIVAISLDSAEARDQALAFIADRGLPFTLWLDPDDRATEVFAAPSLPMTLVIDRGGRIVYRKDGTITSADAALTSAIEKALAP